VPIPDYQTLMLPLLEVSGDGQVHTNVKAVEQLAAKFALTERERRELLPSGRQAKFDNRMGWATWYLKKAGLLETAGRGRFKITERGREVLRGKQARINVAFLRQFPEFAAFKEKPRQQS